MESNKASFRCSSGDDISRPPFKVGQPGKENRTLKCWVALLNSDYIHITLTLITPA